MELLQVNWDDQRNLFLEFRGELKEASPPQPKNIKRLNLKYEISKVKNVQYPITMPSLISVKNFHFIKDSLLFSINLNDLSCIEDLEIKFIDLTIYLDSGIRKRFSIQKVMSMEEIIIDDEYSEYIINKKQAEPIFEGNSQKSSMAREKVYHQYETDLKSQTKKGVYIYEKDSMTLDSDPNHLILAIRDNNERLERVEQELRNLTDALKGVRFNEGHSISHDNSLNAQPIKPIERIKRLPSSNLQKIGISKTPFLGELKLIFNKSADDNKAFHFRDILKPMSDDEISLITLEESELVKREENFYFRKIERLAEEKSEILSLDKLKKPKL